MESDTSWEPIEHRKRRSHGIGLHVSPQRVDGVADYGDLGAGRDNFEDVALQRAHLYHFADVLIEQIHVQMTGVKSGNIKFPGAGQVNGIRGAGG